MKDEGSGTSLPKLPCWDVKFGLPTEGLTALPLHKACDPQPSPVLQCD